MTAGSLAFWSGSVKRTRTRTVAECLGSVAAFTRIPLINSHLDRHLASPHAARTLFLVCSCCKSPMAAFAIDRKRRWNTAPWGRLCLFLNITCSDFQIADLIKLNGLKTRIGNRQCTTGYSVADPEMVFGVSAFSHADEKFSGLTSDTAAYTERITQICVAALIERATQSDPRLYRNQHTVPRNCFNNMGPRDSQAAGLFNLYSWCSPPRIALVTT